MYYGRTETAAVFNRPPSKCLLRFFQQLGLLQSLKKTHVLRIDHLSNKQMQPSALSYLWGGYKRRHTLAHRQPEKHPCRHPSEGNSVTIHPSSHVWTIHTSVSLSIHRRMVHTSELWFMDHPFIHTSEAGPYIRGLSIHRSSDVRSCIPTYGYFYTIPYLWSPANRKKKKDEKMFIQIWVEIWKPRTACVGAKSASQITSPSQAINVFNQKAWRLLFGDFLGLNFLRLIILCFKLLS